MNNSREKHKELAVGIGILVLFPKPNKTEGPVKQLRTIILLPIIRKILSNKVLPRIKPKVGKFLSESQSAYIQFRSTSDTVWAHRVVSSEDTSLQRKSLYHCIA